jgi:hypothetical protein
MPFKDDAARKTYFREYRRNQRAGQPQPKREREPNDAAIAAMDREIAGWMQRTRHQPEWGQKVLDAMAGLDLNTDDGIRELARLYYAARRDHRAAVTAKREEDARLEAERKAERKAQLKIDIERCDFCRQLPSADRVMIAEGYKRVCEHCARRFMAKVAAVSSGNGDRIKRCNFCGKVRDEVRSLFVGLDGVHICDECVANAVEIIKDAAA